MKHNPAVELGIRRRILTPFACQPVFKLEFVIAERLFIKQMSITVIETVVLYQGGRKIPAKRQ
jgi:hypothetical protein